MRQFAHIVESLEQAPAGSPFITFCGSGDEPETVTFGEFRDRAQAQAGALQDRGLTSGDRVVIIMPQGIAAMTTFAAAMMMGAIPAFLAYPNFKVEPSKYRSGLAGVTANLGAKVIVIDEDFPDEMLACVSMDAATNLLRVGGSSQIERASTFGSKDPIAIRPDSVAFIQHSAGTTGLQKGVALTHSAVLRQIEHLARSLQIDSSRDRVYSWLPLYHDMGLIACFILPMVCHVPIVMESPMDWVMRPDTMLQIIDEYRCTLAWMPNFAFQFVPRRTPKNRRVNCDLSCLRLLINCSEPVRAESMSEFQEAFAISPGVLQASYAMAENVFAVTQTDVGSGSGPKTIWVDGEQFRKANRIVHIAKKTPKAVTFTSSGRLLAGVEVRIVSDSGSTLQPDAVGEIAIKSDCLFDGYFNRPDLTSRALVDGWYRTGDLGFSLEDELYVVGRKKDMLIVGGENIYPQDIEEIVGTHAAIHDGRVIAIGLYNPDLGTQDVVVVAEVEREELLGSAEDIETKIRAMVVAGLGIAVRTIILKPPKWIVKSTAGKAARSASKEKLLHEHPELEAANRRQYEG